MTELNETHEPTLTSWLVSANDGKTDFPIQNLPFGVFRVTGSSESFRCGVAIGNQIIDLKSLRQQIFSKVRPLKLCHCVRLTPSSPLWHQVRHSGRH